MNQAASSSDSHRGARDALASIDPPWHVQVPAAEVETAVLAPDSGTSEGPWTGNGIAHGLSDALREVGGPMKLHAPHGPAVLELRRWASSVFCQGSAMAEDIRTDSGVLCLRGRVCGGCVVGRH